MAVGLHNYIFLMICFSFVLFVAFLWTAVFFWFFFFVCFLLWVKSIWEISQLPEMSLRSFLEMFCRWKSCLVTCLGKLFSGQDGGILLYIYIYVCVCIHTLRQEVVHVRKFLSMALRLSGFCLLLQMMFQGHWIATAAVSVGSLFNADLVFSIYLLFTVVIYSLHFKSSSHWFWRFWPPPVVAFVSSSNKRGRNIMQPRSQPRGSFMKMFYCSHADGCTLAEIGSRQKYLFVFPSQKKDSREKPATKITNSSRDVCVNVWI